MKDDVKKEKAIKDNVGTTMLSLAIIIFILTFFMGWNSDKIYDRIFFVPIFLDGFIILLNLIFILFAIISRRISKSKLTLIGIIIIIISIICRFVFPFRNVRTALELYIYEDERLYIIEKVKDNKIEIDENGNANLPKKLKKVSSDGKITVYQNNDDGQVICFWIFRGLLSGSNQLMYSTGGEKLIRENETGHPIIQIKKLKDNWYYVETDY